MAKHMVIANQKGGVGKTTTAVNLTASLHAAGKSVLLCDFDPQANATSGLGVDKNAVSPNIYDILIDGADVERGVVQTPWGDVLPSNKELAGAGVEMIGMDRREYLLQEALDKLSDRYDYILIDCPPSLELLTLNGLCAADSVLIPVQCEYYALEGLSDLLSTVRIVKKKLNPSITIEGVLLTMYDGRNNAAKTIRNVAIGTFGEEMVFRTTIPRNTTLNKAVMSNLAVCDYDDGCSSCRSYRELAQEMEARLDPKNA